ncbi:hypothetical protein Tco_0422294 [Tanacetum coccineum]
MYARIAWTSFEDRSAAIEGHVRILEAQVATLIVQTSSLQTQLTTTLGRIETLEARNPEPQDEPAEAGSSSRLALQRCCAEHECGRIAKNGDDSHDSRIGRRRQVSTVREYTYTDFLNCQPMNFKGTEGVVRLSQWLEKTESVFYISNCTLACQELALMWDRIFLEKSDLVEKYVGCLPDMIHRIVKASKPKTMQEAIEFATELMDKKILTITERQAENKRKFEDTSRNNQNQQQPFKRNIVAQAYTTGPGEKKLYGGSKPLCPKCNYHHDGLYAPKCTNYKRIGHSARDCKSRHGHFKSDCPKLKNENQGNQAGNGNAIVRAYVVGTVGTNPNSNVVTGTFLLNNRFASILFDTGVRKRVLTYINLAL